MVIALAAAACSVEKMPPLVMVRHGAPGPVRRVALLPAECGTTLCKGLDAIVAADLAFRGYDVMELSRIAAIERRRPEVIVSDRATARTSAGPRSATVAPAVVWVLA